MKIITFKLLLALMFIVAPLVAGAAIERDSWVDDPEAGSVSVPGERGIYDSVEKRSFDPAQYTAPSIPGIAGGGGAGGGGGMGDGLSIGASVDSVMDGITAGMSEEDWSRRLFKDMFGIDWTTITTHANSAGPDTASSQNALFTLLYGLNIVALAAVSMILIYTIIMGAIGTSHEGQAGGKSMHTVFTPIRSALAVGYLAPTMKGLSILQVVLLMGFAWSNNFSNFLWSGMLDYMSEHNGALISKVAPETKNRIHKMASVTLEGMTAQAYQVVMNSHEINEVATGEFVPVQDLDIPVGSPSEYAMESPQRNKVSVELAPPLPAGVAATVTPQQLVLYGKGHYGHFTIDCSEEPMENALCRTHNVALQTLINDLVPVANQLVSSMVPDSGVDPPSHTAYITAIANYENTMNAGYPAFKATMDEEYEAEMEAFIESARTVGWMSAGSYYWTLARLNEKTTQEIIQFPSYSTLSVGLKNTMPDEVNAYVEKARKFADNSMAIDEAQEAGRTTASDSSVPLWDAFREYINPILQQIFINTYIAMLADEDGDPIATLAHVGQGCLSTAQAVFTAAALGAVTADSVDGVAKNSVLRFIPGIAGFTGGAAAGLAKAAEIVFWLVVPFAGMLVLVGLFLAYYLPAVPFVLWLFGIIGLLIMVLEMLFAAPIWAAAHAVPGGEGMAGQYGRQGYLLYMSVLLRGPLMLCGFFCSILAYSALVWLTAKALKVYIASSSGEYLLSPLSILAMLVLITAMFVFMAHKTFSLITHLPEKALSWIGSAGGSFQEAGEEQRISRIFLAGGRMPGGGQAMGQLGKVMKGGSNAVGGAPSGGAGPSAGNSSTKGDDK